MVRMLTVCWVRLQNTGPACLAQRTGCREEGGPAHACSLGLSLQQPAVTSESDLLMGDAPPLNCVASSSTSETHF